MNQIIRNMVAATLLGLIGGAANAQTVELQQNSGDSPRVTGLYADNFYDGGYAGNTATSGPLQGNAGYGTGPDLGFTFSTNAEVLFSGTSSTQGRFQNLPTDAAPGDGNTQVLSFNTTYPTVTTLTNAINFTAGFTGVTFNYSFGSQNQNLQTAEVWSGLNGTGTLLDTINLVLGTLSSTQALNSSTTTITPTNHLYVYTAWSQATDNSFSGVGESVTFGTSTSTSTPDLELDAFTVETVPEPSSWALMLGGLALLAWHVRARRT